MYPCLMNKCVTHPQGAEDCFYGNRLSEHPAVLHRPEAGLSPGAGWPSVPVPHGLRVLPADGGSAAHRAVQVSPEVHTQKER